MCCIIHFCHLRSNSINPMVATCKFQSNLWHYKCQQQNSTLSKHVQQLKLIQIMWQLCSFNHNPAALHRLFLAQMLFFALTFCLQNIQFATGLKMALSCWIMHTQTFYKLTGTSLNPPPASAPQFRSWALGSSTQHHNFQLSQLSYCSDTKCWYYEQPWRHMHTRTEIFT